MPSFAAGDIVLLQFPFTDAAGSKRRPALVLLDTGDEDIVVARVTGQLSATPQDIVLDEWKQAFAAIERSPFLKGENKTGWRASFDFLLQPSSFTKLIEGQYDQVTR